MSRLLYHGTTDLSDEDEVDIIASETVDEHTPRLTNYGLVFDL